VSGWRQLVKDNSPLAKWLARKWYEKSNFKINYDDLLGECYLGLVKAAQTFRPKLGNKFSTYASTCMENQIKMLLRKENKRDSINITCLTPKRAGGLDNSQTAHEFSFKHNVIYEDTKQIYDRLIDLMEIEIYFSNIQEYKLSDIINKPDKINKKQRNKIIFLAFISGKTQQQIADKLNLSQSLISKIVKRIRDDIQNKIA
jgi:RNA polymerase sporulation-specific sigma factor